jgi:hypothetical protein
MEARLLAFCVPVPFPSVVASLTFFIAGSAIKKQNLCMSCGSRHLSICSSDAAA